LDALLHQILAGLATGGIYASVALALVMIYQATHLVNFAQGELAMFATYLAWSLINAGMGYWPAFFLTIGLAFVLGVLIERIIIRPVENAPVLAVVVVFIALIVILNSVAGWIYTYTIKTFPSPFPAQPLFGNKYMSSHEMGAIGVTLVVLLLLYGFFRFTPLGLAMRAAAQNAPSARLVGIRVGWMLALGWGLAAAIGAVPCRVLTVLAGSRKSTFTPAIPRPCSRSKSRRRSAGSRWSRLCSQTQMRTFRCCEYSTNSFSCASLKRRHWPSTIWCSKPSSPASREKSRTTSKLQRSRSAPSGNSWQLPPPSR